MNKDEAERCINIARRCISEGNTEKAEKFLKKSLALHESAAARGELHLSLYRRERQEFAKQVICKQYD